ncbi:MAG: thioredoxin [Bacillota bacterium]|nr:thioredoxin [Bacillota bacterium]
MAEVKLTTDNFKAEVLESEIPVLVDFWAVWCGPCKMVAPVVAEIAEEYEGKVKVGKVNIDEEQMLAMQYNITAIPTLILFKNGEPAQQLVGLRSKAEIEGIL